MSHRDHRDRKVLNKYSDGFLRVLCDLCVRNDPGNKPGLAVEFEASNIGSKLRDQHDEKNSC